MTTNDPLTYEKFNELIERHRALIERLSMSRASGDYHRCAELRQECYISIWKHTHTLRPNSSAVQEAVWIYWQCRNAFRRVRFLNRASQFLPIEDSMADNVSNPSESSLKDAIESCARLLTHHESKAFLLMAEGYNPDEMAQELGIKTQSVIQLRYRIISKLRRNFNQTGSSVNKPGSLNNDLNNYTEPLI